MTYEQRRTVDAFVEAKFGKEAEYEVVEFQKNKKAQPGDIDVYRTCILQVKKDNDIIAESTRLPIVTGYDDSGLGKLLGTIDTIKRTGI